MKKFFVFIVACTLIGCSGMSDKQRMYLARAQQETAQLERQSQFEKQETESVKAHFEKLDTLTRQQRLDYELSELNSQTAKTNQNTKAGTLMGCILRLVTCN